SDIPGLISRDETNPMWFGFKGGKHVLVRSFHVGDRFFADNWPETSRKEFLCWVKKQGYNMLSIASHFLNRKETGRGMEWQTPSLWPLDAKEYNKLEKSLDELAAQHIMIFPFAGFFGKSSFSPPSRLEQ